LDKEAPFTGSKFITIYFSQVQLSRHTSTRRCFPLYIKDVTISFFPPYFVVKVLILLLLAYSLCVSGLWSLQPIASESVVPLLAAKVFSGDITTGSKPHQDSSLS
jgi:hypothetical protein